MSCHNIGMGMNSVVDVVINLYDSGRISKDAARVIIAQCRSGVNWCDGNSYEAIECISDCRCGKCLRLIPEGKLLLNIWNVPDESRINREAFHKHTYATYRFCEDCFAEVISECYYYDDDTNQDIALGLRNYIMGNYPKSAYCSTRKM